MGRTKQKHPIKKPRDDSGPVGCGDGVAAGCVGEDGGSTIVGACIDTASAAAAAASAAKTNEKGTKAEENDANIILQDSDGEGESAGGEINNGCFDPTTRVTMKKKKKTIVKKRRQCPPSSLLTANTANSSGQQRHRPRNYNSHRNLPPTIAAIEQQIADRERAAQEAMKKRSVNGDTRSKKTNNQKKMRNKKDRNQDEEEAISMPKTRSMSARRRLHFSDDEDDFVDENEEKEGAKEKEQSSIVAACEGKIPASPSGGDDDEKDDDCRMDFDDHDDEHGSGEKWCILQDENDNHYRSTIIVVPESEAISIQENDSNLCDDNACDGMKSKSSPILPLLSFNLPWTEIRLSNEKKKDHNSSATKSGIVEKKDAGEGDKDELEDIKLPTVKTKLEEERFVFKKVRLSSSENLQMILDHYQKHDDLGNETSSLSYSPIFGGEGRSSSSSTDTFFDDLVVCMENDWIRLFLVNHSSLVAASSTSSSVPLGLNQSNIQQQHYLCDLQIFLTPNALDSCRSLPLHNTSTRRYFRRLGQDSHRNKFALPDAIERIIRRFFSPASRGHRSSGKRYHSTADMMPCDVLTSKDITAKYVYRLIDNQNLINQYLSPAPSSSSESKSSKTQAFALTLSGKQVERNIGATGDGETVVHRPFPTLHIPGLLPTLRPYQAAAVKWMLEREGKSKAVSKQLPAYLGNSVATIAPSTVVERKDDNDSQSWMIAWWVLCSDRTFFPLSQLNKIEKMLETSTRICLYCPFNGRIALSVDEARDLTFGSNVAGGGRENKLSILKNRSTPNVVGGGGCGILAESMGLGKTVEVLATVLANPMPLPAVAPVTEKNTSDQTCKRQLEFKDKDRHDSIQQDISSVDDISHIADEKSSDEGGDEERRYVSNFDAENSPVSIDSPSNTEPVQINKSAVVTPNRIEGRIEERWIDDMEVGSCICGEIICFNQPGQRRTFREVVVCKSCSEPMHAECSGVDENEIQQMPKMNLRRTFENSILECVICHDCPSCLARENCKISSKATLIICPPTILSQWEMEIKRHTKLRNGNSLNVVVYNSVEMITKTKKNKSQAMQLLHPRKLADADIILVPFTALVSDLGHTQDKNRDGNLRKRKRYRVVPSPLEAITFWRVCFDEAQRVEHQTSKLAKMTHKIDAIHRWAVSGTPIGRGKLHDLYGLLLFLRLSPFDDKLWFEACMSGTVPYVDDRIRTLFRDILWRSTKELKLVKDQIGIPEMKEENVILKFSSIERHFYTQQLERTINAAGDLQTESGSVTKGRLEFLAGLLARLRAACCHPQVGSHGISHASRRLAGQDQGVASRVMPMDEILNRFIDEARLKSEESLRQAIMHTNAMAALKRLQVEARHRGVQCSESDRKLFDESARLYCEALDMARKNAVPTLVSADAIVTGNEGFVSPNTKFRGGRTVLQWKLRARTDEVWAAIDFDVTPKRLTKIRVRPFQSVPEDVREDSSADFAWLSLFPSSVTVQMSNAMTSSDFVDSATSAVVQDGWFDIDCLHKTSKSRNWRIVVQDFASTGVETHPLSCGYFVGVEVELFEAQIDSDSLQLLHSIHNAHISYDQAKKAGSTESFEEVDRLLEDAEQIENLYKLRVQTEHKARKIRFEEVSAHRQEKEKEMNDVTRVAKSMREVKDCWDDAWWDDYITLVLLYGSDSLQHAVLSRILEDTEGTQTAPEFLRFTAFSDLRGLKSAFHIRITKIRDEGVGKKYNFAPSTAVDETELYNLRTQLFRCSRGGHQKTMHSIQQLSAEPADSEVYENSNCRMCKSDWNKTGPVCKVCKISSELEYLRPDSVTITFLTAIHSSLRSPASMALLLKKKALHIADRAKNFFALLEAEEKEIKVAWSMWRQHLSLLNELDELNSCKRAIRLSYDGEDLTRYAEYELNAIVEPYNVLPKFHDHSAKQAMALGDLRRCAGTMRYLMNQQSEELQSGKGTKPDDTCVVCLREFEGECSVLKCGHRFHHKPCFEQILRRPGSNRANNVVECPMKCRVLTQRQEVLIATTKSTNDGTQVKRSVKGSFGTKVQMLCSDVLTMRDKGHKGVIFSQWNDMLDIVCSALQTNGIGFERPEGGRKFGNSIRAFHEDPNCSVLLLNIKQGAEGLTIVNATHVFMMEPTLNNALDAQAINRVHRIGQTRQTVVKRYLIDKSIEVKMDRLRRNQQKDDVKDTSSLSLEDALHAGKSMMFQAGGIDGGFSSREELLDFLDQDK